MKGFRVKALVCALAVLISTRIVFSQDTGATAPPKGLTHGVPVEETAPESSEIVVPAQPGRPQGPRVTVSGLAPVDPSGAGILDSSSGGFGPGLWTGSPRAAIVARLSQLPAATSSPVMQSLTRRLLLSSANPPLGPSPPNEPSMFAQRLNKLIAGGRVAEAAMLGAQSLREDAHARQAWVEALLLQGRDDDACGDAASLRQSSNDAFWLKLRVLCYVQEGNLPAANLTLDVMREKEIQDDVFFQLASAVIDGSKVQLGAMSAPNSLYFSLARRANVTPLTLAGWLPTSSYFSQANDPVMKLVAIDKAAAAGLIPAIQLKEAFDAEPFTPDQLGDPEDWAAKMSPAAANALYFQAISHRSTPAAKAAAFAAALERADSQNRFTLFAEMSRETAKRFTASPETTWLAPYVSRVLLYNGDSRNLAPWLAVLASPTDAPIVNAIQIHAGLTYPSAENLARMQGAMVWLGQNALKPGGAKDWLTARATREIPLLDALGYTIPPEAQWAVSGSTTGIVPSGAAAEALSSLSRSSGQGRVGETLLHSLVAIGPQGPAKAQGQTVARVVSALAMVGLRDEARALASEAVLAIPLKKGL